MKVVSIRRNQFLGRYMSQRAEIMPMWVGFFAGASVTTIGPTLLYCAVSFQLLPLYVMACVLTLGALMGVVMFRRPADDFLLRIPMNSVPFGTLAGEAKRAA